MAAISAPTSTERSRSLVLWFGRVPPPSRLVVACLDHSLQVANASRENFERLCPEARAASFEVPAAAADSDRWSIETIATCLDHGLVVALVMVLADGGDLPVLPPQPVVDRYYAAVAAIKGADERIQALYDNWHNIGHWVRGCSGQAGANPATVLQGDLPPDRSVQILMQRAFCDYSQLLLSAPPSGKSGAGVWRVEVTGPDRERRALPFFVKIHKRDRMMAERSNAMTIADWVSKQYHAPLDAGRCVDGHSLGLAVYDVPANAGPLRTAVRTIARDLVVALFEHALGPARAAGVEEAASLAVEFSAGRVKVLRWSEDLESTATYSRTLNDALPSTADLKARIEALPSMRVRVGMVHGDLHAGNVFAARTEAILIDFGSVTSRAPLVADPACFEVSLTFPSGPPASGASVGPSVEWLRETYRYPLAHEQVQRLHSEDAWLSEAVKEIRLRAVSPAKESAAYAFAVACNLLRYASHSDNGTLEHRGLAYQLACNLFAQVEREQLKS